MSATLPSIYPPADRHRHHRAHLRGYILAWTAGIIALGIGFKLWSRGEAAREKIDRVKMKVPVLGDIWIKYQVAQFSRVLSTLLTGGNPLVVPGPRKLPRISLGTPLLRKNLSQSWLHGSGRAGPVARLALWPPPVSCPPLSVDMIEVGESTTGALPPMLSSVAEFYEDDVNTKMTAVPSLIEPAIMIFRHACGVRPDCPVHFPIFSLADTIK